MSFKTDKPFFPYSEPSDVRHGEGRGRLLRLFFVSGQRMEGELDDRITYWPGETVWANPLMTAQREALAGFLKMSDLTIPAEAWLTVFDDKASPRPGIADLYFSSSSNQTRLHREPIIEYQVVNDNDYTPWIVNCSLLLLAPLGLVALLQWRSRRKASANADK